MKHFGTLNESSIHRKSSEFSHISDAELLREVYYRSQTDQQSSIPNSISMIGFLYFLYN